MSGPTQASQNLNSFLTDCGVKVTRLATIPGSRMNFAENEGLTVLNGQTPTKVTVNFLDKHAGIAVHFSDGVATHITVDNPGRSGSTSFKATSAILAKVSTAGRSKPGTEGGRFTATLARGLGIANVNFNDARPGFSTSTWEGAQKGIAAIQETLAQQAGFYIAPRVAAPVRQPFGAVASPQPGRRA